MKTLYIALWAEFMKIRNSRVLWITILLFAFMPCMLGLMFFVQMHPEISAKLGIIGTKAGMMRLGNGDWKAFLELSSQTSAAIGMIGFGFVISWIFGREYADRTVKDLLAIPVKRFQIVCAKFLLATAWCFLLIVVFFSMALAIGRFNGITGWNDNLLIPFILLIGKVSFFTLLVSTPVAFLASYGRGYMLAMGFVILTMVLANFTGMIGLGSYFPWSIPGLMTVNSSADISQPGLTSYIIVILTSFAGFASTAAWWNLADQH